MLIHYWQLPEDLFISLKEDFHKKFCLIIREKINIRFKNCFYKILNCPKWHAQRIFTQFTRFTIKELEILREFSRLSREEIEENIDSIGNHEDGAFVKNPRLPFNLKDIFYVASHLIFDGSFRTKRGGYFYSYEDSLTEYHKKRLKNFGDFTINLIKKEYQIYFTYTIGYIAKKVLEIESFNSMKCKLSNKFKSLAKENKMLADEIIKALIIDEGCINDKITIELANKELVEDLYQIIKVHYNLTKLFTRKRNTVFKENPKWNRELYSWGFRFSGDSIKELYSSISPLPIDYKEKALELSYKIKIRPWKQNQKKIKKLIVQLLLEKPLTISELSDKLEVKRCTISAHLKGNHPTYSTSLIKLGIVEKKGFKILRRGGYTKADIFGINNLDKAKEFVAN